MYKHMIKTRNFTLPNVRKICPPIQDFAQIRFATKFEELKSHIKDSSPYYAMTLLRTTDILLGKLGKHLRLPLNAQIDTKELREHVFLKILEDCDNSKIVSNKVLISACHLIKEVGQIDSSL